MCVHHSEVAVPSVIVLNTSNEQYFLPSEPIESLEQLITFISSVMDGTAQVIHGSTYCMNTTAGLRVSLSLTNFNTNTNNKQMQQGPFIHWLFDQFYGNVTL